MKMILKSRTSGYMARVGILLITLALIVGTANCGGGGGGGPTEYSLSMVVAPAGNGTATDLTNASPYAVGSVVTIEAVATAGYGFRDWAATAGGFADTNAAQTTFTMPAQNVTVTGNFGPFAGGSGTQGDPYKIADWYQLHMVRSYLSNHFILANNLNSTTAGYTALAGPTANGGKGWQPIGSQEGTPTIPVYIDPFTGTFDGQGYEIRDLFIDRSDESGVGLFGAVDVGGVIENVKVMDANVTGDWNVGILVGGGAGDVTDCCASGNVRGISNICGGLVGFNEGGTVSNCYASSSVDGYNWAGGLLGANWWGSVSNCYATGNVTCGYGQAGGLVAWNHYATVINSHATGDVTANRWVGGLVGTNYYGTVSNSHASGNVIGYVDYIGGLVGSNAGPVSNCYATGNVTGGVVVGGLVGTSGAAVSNSYSSGSVSGNNYVGGLVGDNYYGATVSNSYSRGSVSGSWNVGGLVGRNFGTVGNSFWDTQTSGQGSSAGGTGKNTTEMKDISTFSGAGWDIVAVANSSTRNTDYLWNIVDDVTYAFLSWQPV